MSNDHIDFDKAFSDLIDEVSLKRREFNAPIVVGQTPEVLLTVGQNSLPIAMPASVVHKAREKHGVSVEDIKTLPRQLRNPVMIFESETHTKSLNVLVDFRNREGKPVTVAIHFNVPIASHIGHKVATISERNESQIELWKAKGLLRYVNQEKEKTWIQFAGLHLPGEESTSKVNVKEISEIVNSPRSGKGKKVAQSQEKQKAQVQYTGLQLPGDGSTPEANIPRKTENVNRPSGEPSGGREGEAARSLDKQKAQIQYAGLQLPGEGSTLESSVSKKVVDGSNDLVANTRQETESRLLAREDLAPEAKAGVREFLNRQEAEKIWKSQTLDADGRIAFARVVLGEKFEEATKGLPEIQHGVVRALARAHARGQERGPQCSL